MKRFQFASGVAVFGSDLCPANFGHRMFLLLIGVTTYEKSEPFTAASYAKATEAREERRE